MLIACNMNLLLLETECIKQDIYNAEFSYERIISVKHIITKRISTKHIKHKT